MAATLLLPPDFAPPNLEDKSSPALLGLFCSSASGDDALRRSPRKREDAVPNFLRERYIYRGCVPWKKGKDVLHGDLLRMEWRRDECVGWEIIHSHSRIG